MYGETLADSLYLAEQQVESTNKALRLVAEIQQTFLSARVSAVDETTRKTTHLLARLLTADAADARKHLDYLTAELAKRRNNA
jgi:DNA-binding transcriptional regulator YbjK